MLLNPYRFGTPAVVDDVVLFARFDGANGSTIFTDSSPYNRVLVPSGTPTISTAQSKFGGASLAILSGGELNCADAGLALGIGDFTIDTFLYWTAASGTSQRGAFQFGGGAAGYSISATTTITVFANTGGVWGIYAGGSFRSSGVAIPINQWVHFLVARSAGITKVFANGIQILSFADAVNYGLGCLIGGYYSNAYRFDGYIDQMRVKKGVADYTANFTPPNIPYP